MTKIHGQYVSVRARVEHLQTLSAHVDADEILAWLRLFKSPPKQTFVTHGELSASDALRHRIEKSCTGTSPFLNIATRCTLMNQPQVKIASEARLSRGTSFGRSLVISPDRVEPNQRTNERGASG
jgi:hypothetical protein